MILWNIIIEKVDFIVKTYCLSVSACGGLSSLVWTSRSSPYYNYYFWKISYYLEIISYKRFLPFSSRQAHFNLYHLLFYRIFEKYHKRMVIFSYFCFFKDIWFILLLFLPWICKVPQARIFFMVIFSYLFLWIS